MFLIKWCGHYGHYGFKIKTLPKAQRTQGIEYFDSFNTKYYWIQYHYHPQARVLIYCLVGGEVLLLLVGPRLLCHPAPRSGHWSRQYVVAAVAALHCYKSLYSLPPNSCPHHWSRTQPRKGIFDLRRTCGAGRQPQHHHVLPLLLQSPCSIEQSSGSRQCDRLAAQP